MSGDITMSGFHALCRVAAGLDDHRGGAGTPGGQTPGTGDRTNDSARPIAGADPPRRLRRSRSSASRVAADHRTLVGVNPDASRSCTAPGSDPPARHGCAGPYDWPGSAVRQIAANGAVPAERSEE